MIYKNIFWVDLRRERNESSKVEGRKLKKNWKRKEVKWFKLGKLRHEEGLLVTDCICLYVPCSYLHLNVTLDCCLFYLCCLTSLPREETSKRIKDKFRYSFIVAVLRQIQVAFLFLHPRVTERRHGNNAEEKEIELAEFSGHGLCSREVLLEGRRGN